MRTWIPVVGVSVLVLAVIAGWPGDPAAAVEQPLSIDIVVSPSTIALGSKGTWVTVHADIDYVRVDSMTVTLDGLPVVYTKSDLRGDLVAKFRLGDVKGIVQPGCVELVLRGETVDGLAFVGADEVRVKE
jgi:hypothetical protein